MITIGIFEAKSHLVQLAQAAAEGEEVVLTRRGNPSPKFGQPRAGCGR